LRLIPLRGRTRAYERLSPQDASFLAFEKPNILMTVGGELIFEMGSIRAANGRVDVPKFRRYIEARIDTVARSRQRLSRTSLLRRPIWVDDASFVIAQHVVSVDLGDAAEDQAALRRLSGEIFSRPLDRSRPLWEITVVEGTPDAATFAVVCKVSHGMIDGIAGMDFAGALLAGDPQATLEGARSFVPLGEPSPLRLALDDIALVASAPPRLAAGIFRLATRRATRASFRERAWALVHLFASGLRGTTRTPLSEPPLASRFHGWAAFPKSSERMIRARLGGSRDDVALATATGATRASLLRRGAAVKAARIRAMAPMSLRARSERGTLGNRVSMLIVDLPVDEADPARRLRRLSATMARLKRIKQGLGVDVLAAIDEFAGTSAQRFAMWLATLRRTYNVVITNVPGPPTPLYALESQLLAIYPVAPVFGGQHINFAALSYLGTVHWGVQYAGGDAAELAAIMRDLEASFAELCAAASGKPPRIRVVSPLTDAGQSPDDPLRDVSGA
jgi:WS/DGAT/MGAT family acyltransferase